MVEKSNALAVTDRAAAGRLMDNLLEADPAGYVLYFGAGLLWLVVALAIVTALRRSAHPGPYSPDGHGRPRVRGRPCATDGPNRDSALFLAGVAWLELRPRPAEPRRGRSLTETV